MFGACSSGPLYGSCDVHVDRRARDLAGLERCDQRGLVHQFAARCVDDAHTVAHPRDRFGIDRVARVVGQREMKSQEVRALRAPRRSPHCRRRARGSARPRRTGRTQRPSSAVPRRAVRPGGRSARTQHSEHLVGELDPAPLRPFPTAGGERRVCLRDVAREREQQADGVLGGRDDVRLGRIRNDDPAPGRRVDVDVVDADAGAPDRPSAAWRVRSRRT